MNINQLTKSLNAMPWSITHRICASISSGKQTLTYKINKDDSLIYRDNNGTVVLRSGTNNGPEWNNKWLKSLSKNQQQQLSNELLDGQISITEVGLHALSLAESENQDQFEFSITKSKNQEKAIVRLGDGKAFGRITAKGFKPTKNAAKTWEKTQKILNGNLDFDAFVDLDKWAARDLINLSSISRVGSGSPHAFGINKDTKIRDNLRDLANQVFKRPDTIALNPDGLEPDFGGTFSGKTWILSQASPSKIGTYLDHRTWMGAINTGRPQTIAVDPADQNNIIVGMQHAGLWHSENGGENWKQVSDQDLGAPIAPNEFSHLAAYQIPNQAETLLLAFSYNHSNSDNGNPRNTMVSLDGGKNWTINTSITNNEVNDTLKVGNKIVVASEDSFLKVHDISNGLDDFLNGSLEGVIPGKYYQLKPIPGGVIDSSDSRRIEKYI